MASLSCPPAALEITKIPAAELDLSNAVALLTQAGWCAPAGATQGKASWAQAVIDGLCDLSSRDSLTGLANRRQFEAALGREIDRVARVGEPSLLLVADIDHFKVINDTHGHLSGDAVIRAVAECLQECVRPMDLVARVGGEEFSIILPNCPPAFGHTVAERIRHRVAQRQITLMDGTVTSVTVSIGGAFAPQWVRSSVILWSERADQQLYRAKAEGRNRTCLDTPPLTVVSAEEKSFLFSSLAQSDTPSASENVEEHPKTTS